MRSRALFGRSATLPPEELARRAGAPLYRDPFEGLCAHARALAPADRAGVTRACPRCGERAGLEATDPGAACLLEGTALDLLAAQARAGR